MNVLLSIIAVAMFCGTLFLMRKTKKEKDEERKEKEEKLQFKKRLRAMKNFRSRAECLQSKVSEYREEELEKLHKQYPEKVAKRLSHYDDIPTGNFYEDWSCYYDTGIIAPGTPITQRIPIYKCVIEEDYKTEIENIIRKKPHIEELLIIFDEYQNIIAVLEEKQKAYEACKTNQKSLAS